MSNEIIKKIICEKGNLNPSTYEDAKSSAETVYMTIQELEAIALEAARVALEMQSDLALSKLAHFNTPRKKEVYISLQESSDSVIDKLK